MDIRYVLLTPKGRLGSRDFLRGLILVTAAFMLMQVASTFLSPAFGILVYPMVYVYVCLYSKRLHDAGHSGWFYLLFLAGYMIANALVGALLMPILSPGAFEYFEAFQGDMAGALNELMANSEDFNRSSALTNLASFLLTSALLGFIGARLPTDPDANRHGPPTTDTQSSDKFH